MSLINLKAWPSGLAFSTSSSRALPRLTGRYAAAVSFVMALGVTVGLAGAEDLPAQPPEITERIELCASCHGPDGLPLVEKAPILWGQHSFYLLTQLKDYRAERRANEIMTPIAKDLSDAEMKALASYFSKQPWPNYHEPSSAEDKARAQGLAVEAACTSCHLGGMLGDSRNPRLNHQKVDYLRQTLTDFRDNIRKNAPPMAAIVRDWSDDDVAAMSRYLAGL